ncbi:MAG: primosomal protein N', partial [Thermoleophilia bacterium]
GAGKTEVYLRTIEEAMARGGSAIVLVPEISLTHQAVKRFRRRFGEKVGIIHSGLSPGERYDEYMRIRSGEVGVVIGPRSALFAPLPNLRLIVIDEENDSSFKQENDPRYDARRTAMERARLEGASLVLGSATPRLESYHHVADRFVLPERATGASMPDVEIIDMRDERDAVFSRRLISELDRTLAAGEKAILLLNSRGYASYLQCAQCGHVWECANCEVSLTIHSRIHRLLCHHCGYGEDVPPVCPKCQSAELRRWGVGTQRLEDELNARFPEATIFRLDADTARGYGEGPRILEEFGRAGSAILLGTQMVAKGHHFPEVTLSAVINADLALRFPEFRAEENTFALLVQLAGRSGRAAIHGRVLIQTWNAEIECIRMAAQQALDEFYQAELDRRGRLGYPPFVNLINIICLSRKCETPVQAAGFLRDKLEPVMSDEEVLGPADLFRMQGWSRSHILVKTKDVERTLAAFKPVLEHFREPFHTRGVRIVVDVDPQWLF